jgi:hypothetical protein
VAIIAALVSIFPYPLQDLRPRWGIFIVAILVIVFLAVGRRPFGIIMNKITSAQSTPITESTNTILSTPQVDPIHHYCTWDALPFVDMISIAKSTVEMSAVSFTILTLQHYEAVRSTIARGVKFTLLILDPNSQYVQKQTDLYHATEDLKNQIEKSIIRLCNLQKEYPQDVIIRTYDSLARYSITIIDRANVENAWIRIERRPVGSDSNSRSSDAAYRKYDLGFFDQYMNEYDILFNNSNEYRCPIS